MHGRSSVSDLLVNVEVDSMGRVVDGGVGLDVKTSPRHAAIEKAQAALRQEFDVREERRRELEFLENGGNPLDFKIGQATSVSVQSTSLVDQLAEHYANSEAKSSFALDASPHGDSVDSSGRPGPTLGGEPSTADNLLLFHGDNDVLDGERDSAHQAQPSRTNIAQSEQSSQLDGSFHAKESDDSAIFRLGVKSQAYARRRSRSNRDSTHTSSTDLVRSSHGNGASSMLPFRHSEARDGKEASCDAPMDKEPTCSSICNSKTSLNGYVGPKTCTSDNQLDAVCTHEAMPDVSKVRRPEDGTDTRENVQNRHSQVGNWHGPDVAGLVLEKEEKIFAGPDFGLFETAKKTERSSNLGQPEGVADKNANEFQGESQNNSSSVVSTKGLNSGSSCLDGNILGTHPLKSRKMNNSSNGNPKELLVVCEQSSDVQDANEVKENEKPIVAEVKLAAKDDCKTVDVKMEQEICDGKSDFRHEAKLSDHPALEAGGLPDNSTRDESTLRTSGLIFSQLRAENDLVFSSAEKPPETSSGKDSGTFPELQSCAGNHLKTLNRAHEDTILEKAQMIQVNRRKFQELSTSSSQSEKRRKSHWDFVLEEMTWLANDFMQERLWKTTAASWLSRSVAFNGRVKFNEENMRRKQQKVGHILSKAITQFWKSAELGLNCELPASGEESNSTAPASQKVKVDEAVKDKIEEPSKLQEMGNAVENPNSGQKKNLAVQEYAVRFLKYNSTSSDRLVQAEAPMTPDRISDMGILAVQWEDQLSEESLFYTVPSGATEDYRKSVESLWAQYEKIGSGMNEKIGSGIHPDEFETSLLESVSEYGARDNPYEEDEGETGRYYLPGAFEGSKPSKFAQRKRKNPTKLYTRPYDVGPEVSYGHCLERKNSSQPLLLTGKRSSGALNVGTIPTKRVRTAARQRVVGPLSSGGISGVQVATKTDASSGDTSSLQDDQSSLHGRSQLRKNSEVESTGEFGKHLSVDGKEISPKPKKKKAKHLEYRNSFTSADSRGIYMPGKGSTFDRHWQIDTLVQHEQRDLSKRKLENHQFESGSTGIYGLHAAKKPKLLKQLRDASPEAIGPVTGSISSPVASQLSNMSNSNKHIKVITGRAPGRKAKAHKMMSACPSGSGSPWSLFEDQALIVLVHDMGPNWELVSDAMNSSLQFKCTFRKPKECKMRHKILMDLRSAGDGADSAEDSGSSQPYPSTLPGIPKSCVGGGTLHQGSARQLFQRLQGPLEEDMLKAHFEKIILIGQQLLSRRNQNDEQELKHITPVHNSHVLALSQVCPNNLNGGILTPLDLCDATTSSQDVLPLGCQGPHTSGLVASNHQGSLGPVLSSAPNSVIRGSSGMVIGNGLPTASSALSSSPRDAHRYAGPRPKSLQMDDQQRIQQYNPVISGRNTQQPTVPASGALQVGNDRGVRILPGGNGMGMMCGMNRGMRMPRPGFQGMGSPAMLNMVSSSGMISPTGVGMPSPVNMHTGPISGQTNSMVPRDTMSMMRPGQNPEDQRHIMMQELQMQVPQANGQALPTPANNLSAAFSSQAVPPPVQPFPVQHQQQHQMPHQSHVLNNTHHPHLQGTNQSNPQQAYVLRLAKERQLQQRAMHQHHQFPSSNSSIPQQQHNMLPLQNGSQASGAPPLNPQQPLTSSSPMNPISSQTQPKHPHGSHSLTRNPQPGGALPNQIGKQRQRQQQLQYHQQQPRSHLQNRQQSHSQQQAMHIKGLGRGGSTMMHQNLSIDPTHVNGLPPENQISGKSEPIMHMMQSQGLYPSGGSSTNSVHHGKQLVHQPSNPGPQPPKMFSRPVHEQLPPIPSHIDSSNQGQASQVLSSHNVLLSQQPIPSSPLARETSQSQQSIQRIIPQSNRQVGSSDARVQGHSDQLHANQMGQNSAVAQSMDMAAVSHTISSTAASPSQWKTEPTLYGTSTTLTPPGDLAIVGNSSQPNSMGPELGPTSSQGLMQTQFSGSSVSNVSGQWQQQSLAQQQQSQQKQQQKPQ